MRRQFRFFRLGRRPRAGVCERCGSDHHVHRGLCHRCRELVDGGRPVPDAARPAPHQASPEPLHDPPWRRRGA